MFLKTCRSHPLLIPFRTSGSYSHQPLKIAYFGSDSFSLQSLDKLVNYRNKNPDRIASIDVITRSIKPTGRNLKKFVDTPIGNYCGQNNINILRADSGEDILNISSNYEFSLAIAVSYGRLIPSKFLHNCKYGGLNVHPSLLPKYSGSSPLQYALINDDQFTGVTIQTLHPSKFDKGDIILQSGEVPIEENETFSSLQNKLGTIGSDLLIRVIDEKLFINKKPIVNTYKYSLASKVLPSKSEILWSKLTARNIKRLNDALGQLHSFMFVDTKKKKRHIQEYQKIIFNDITALGNTSCHDLNEPGKFKLNEKDNRLMIKTIDGCISVGKLKFQYCGEEDPITFMKYLSKRTGETECKFSNKDKTTTLKSCK